MRSQDVWGIIIVVLFILFLSLFPLSEISRNKFRIVKKRRKNGSEYYDIERLKGMWILRSWERLYMSEQYLNLDRFCYDGRVTKSPYPNEKREWNTAQEAADYLKEIIEVIKGPNIIKEYDV